MGRNDYTDGSGALAAQSGTLTDIIISITLYKQKMITASVKHLWTLATVGAPTIKLLDKTASLNELIFMLHSEYEDDLTHLYSHLRAITPPQDYDDAVSQLVQAGTVYYGGDKTTCSRIRDVILENPAIYVLLLLEHMSLEQLKRINFKHTAKV